MSFLKRLSLGGQRNFPILMIGSKGVGTTSVARACAKTRFPSSTESQKSVYHATVGDTIVEFHELSSDGSTLAKIEPCAPSFKAFILIYAMDDVTSFDYVSKVRDIIILARGEDVPIIFVRNKSDLFVNDMDRIINDCIITIDWECPHYEISAKRSHGISDLLKEVVTQIDKNAVNASIEPVQPKLKKWWSIL